MKKQSQIQRQTDNNEYLNKTKSSYDNEKSIDTSKKTQTVEKNEIQKSNHNHTDDKIVNKTKEKTKIKTDKNTKKILNKYKLYWQIQNSNLKCSKPTG